MKIDKDIMNGLEEYLTVMLVNSTSGKDLAARDYAIDVSLKLSQLILNLTAIQGAKLQEDIMENMKDIDLSTIDFNKMLEGLMRGDV